VWRRGQRRAVVRPREHTDAPGRARIPGGLEIEPGVAHDRDPAGVRHIAPPHRQEDHVGRRAAVAGPGGRLHPARVFSALAEVVPEGAVIAVDVGNNAYAFGHYFTCRAGQDVLMSGYLGSIGFALPAAMGAWAATRGARRIVSVSGDGGLGQYLAEVTTAVRYRMPIVHVVLVDNELGKISREQITAVRPVWQTALVNPEFAEYARGCGAVGIRVEGDADLDDALRRAFAVTDGPVLVEVPVTARAV